MVASAESDGSWRAEAEEAEGRVVAAEVSVLEAVLLDEGCEEAVAEVLAAKEPFDERESAARESEVMGPGFSTLVAVGSVIWGVD